MFNILPLCGKGHAAELAVDRPPAILLVVAVECAPPASEEDLHQFVDCTGGPAACEED